MSAQNEYNDKTLRMKIALCVIARLENRYIREFIEYYKNLGIDKIFLYDNNDPGGEDFLEVLSDYIDSGFIELTDFRTGHRFVQVVLDAYQDCYSKHSTEYDWICFFDPDEYLVLENHKTIKSWLSQNIFKEFQLIHINWMTYDDNDLLVDDGRDLNIRFTRPVDLGHIENHHIKSIIRGGLEGLYFDSPHTPKIPENYKVCNGSGRFLRNTIKTQRIYHTGAWLKHFRCKTITEYMENKLPKLTLSGYDNINFDDDFFFLINKKTPEKTKIYQDYIKKYTKKDYNPVIEYPSYLYSILTVITGNNSCDILKEVENPVSFIHYICVTDRDDLVSRTWDIIYYPDFSGMSEIERFKYPKFHPFEFCDTDVCVYLDSTIQIKKDFTNSMVKYFLDSNYVLGLFPHPKRCDIYKEIDSWVVKRNYPENIAKDIMNFYWSQGYTEKTLFFLCMILYKKSGETEKVLSGQWEIMKKYGYQGDVSRSDQIFFPFICHENFGENIQDKILLYDPRYFRSGFMIRTDRRDGHKFNPPKKDMYLCFSGLVKPYNTL